jgi:serine/threonine-protein kinase
MSTSPVADRNLLFGILAVQMNFIDGDTLVAAMHTWTFDKSKSIGQILFEKKQLTSEQLAALDGLIALHLKSHGNDASASLQALSTRTIPAGRLAEVADADVQASIMLLGDTLWTGATQDFRPPAADARYQILRPHARGNLGEVFVAEDMELHRMVALKEIQSRLAHNARSRMRFVLEAEITGGLEHPGIVPVYGLGAYADGRPYYAMRFIRGETLKSAIGSFHAADKAGRDASERSLALHQLLRRFCDLCNTVAYAHSRGVLHRDIKPENVMLGKYGETLVVDWGLAKPGVERIAATPEHADPTELTLQPASGSVPIEEKEGSCLGTPAFMSPEQAAGRLSQMGPTSDIYSLGATLYVLLTGKKPFDGADAGEVLEKVKRGRFIPPSEAKPGTPRALDAICRKAMSAAPADRYKTAMSLADDVEHWLADEPVAAYPEPILARGARWVRRHRTTAVAAAVLLVSTVVALSISTLLIWREQQRTDQQRQIAVKNEKIAERHKQVAEQNYNLARDLSYASLTLIEAAQPQFAAVPSLQLQRKEILVASSRAFRHFLEIGPDDRELQLKAAEIFRFTANLHRLHADMAAAEPLYVDAIKNYEQLTRTPPTNPIGSEKLAETLRDRASVQGETGRLLEAKESLEKSIDLAKKSLAENPMSSWAKRNLAAALLDLSINEIARGLHDDAEKSARHSVLLFEELSNAKIGERYPNDPLLFAAALNALAVAKRDGGHLAEAIAEHSKALNLLNPLQASVPEGVNVADLLFFLCCLQVDRSRTCGLKDTANREFGVKELGSAIEVLSRLAHDYPAIPMYRAWQSNAYQARGLIRAQLGNRDEARADLREAMRYEEKLIQAYPDIPAWQADLGRTYLALAKLESEQKIATEWIQKAAAALRGALTKTPDDAQTKRSLEEALAEQRK